MGKETDTPHETLEEIRERGAMDYAGDDCTYCRDADTECRPTPVVGRYFIPALCNQCYRELADAGRLDRERDREVFFPDV